MKSTSTDSAVERVARGRLGLLCLLVWALTLSCAKHPATALVFRVLGENLVPLRCNQPAYRDTPECPASAYRIESVLVRVCRGACTMPDATVCQGDEQLCETYADGLMRTPRTVLPGDVTVAPEDPATLSRVGVVVTATVRVPDSDTAERIRRRFVVQFVRESTRVVEVWLSSLCIGAVCPPETSCGRRSCEPVENPPTQPFTPLPDAGVSDGGDLDVSFDVVRRDVSSDASDASDASDVSDASVVSDGSDVRDVSDASDVSDVSDVTDAMDVVEDRLPPADASTIMDIPAGRDSPTVDAPEDVAAADVVDASCSGCSAGTTCCGGMCVDLQSNNAHCGRCDFGCAIGANCTGGTCERLGAIAAGGAQTCGFYGRALFCWGRNNDGRLGPATVTSVDRPTSVTSRNGIVVASPTHTCVWPGDGNVGCWGSNAHSELGVEGRSTSRVDTIPMLTASSVAVGVNFTCATRGSGEGEVLCWGLNDLGQCGRSPGGDVVTPTAVPGVPASSKVVAGRAHACALAFSGGRVFCWGANGNGQTGRGTTSTPALPVQVTLPGAASDLFAGPDHTCAIVGGGVHCWGSNRSGQADPTSTTTNVLAPTASSVVAMADGPVSAGAAGDTFSCVVVESGAVLCWGTGEFGELGDASRRVATSPTAVAGVTVTVPTSGLVAPSRYLTAGARHVCAHTTAGLRCWGNNRWGQLGVGTSGRPRATPAPVNVTATTPTSLSVGYGHACAVLAGNVWCWGRNAEGQLGVADDANRAEPVQSTTTGGFSSVCAGEKHTCAVVNATGAVQCWGDNTAGQLGRDVIGGMRLARGGVTLPTGSTAATITCGRAHTCITTRFSNPRVLCWGDNTYGQMGADRMTMPAVASPTPMFGWTNAASVSAGGDTTCAHRSDGSVWCWGSNIAGQLGVGRPDPDAGVAATSEEPLAVSAVSAALGVSTGATHACARSAAGAWCWGFNLYGRLGRATSTSVGELPASVMALSAPSTMTAGFSHTCAIVAGQARCWGANHAGQVGNGAPSEAVTTPVALSGSTFAPTAISAGGGFAPFDTSTVVTGITCAHDGSEVRCWGSNEWGELGDGAAFRATPSPVTFTP